MIITPRAYRQADRIFAISPYMAECARKKGANPDKLARTAIKNMEPEAMYRVLVAHADNREGAQQLRHHVLEQHAMIHSCHITDAGPALGVHIGPGGLVVGFAPIPRDNG